MATNTVHFANHVNSKAKDKDFTESEVAKEAAIVIIPDSLRCYTKTREETHCTNNPETGENSWFVYPSAPICEWDEELISSCARFNAGKPGESCVDEETILSEFWRHNLSTPQNQLIFIHNVQDNVYDSFRSNVIDCSRRYWDIYSFDGQELSGDDLRGKGMKRWHGDGLLNQLDGQFFTRIAKRYYESTGILMNSDWIEETMKPAIADVYSAEFAEKTLPFVRLNLKANEIISAKAFDEELWPIRNHIVDRWIDKMDEYVRFMSV